MASMLLKSCAMPPVSCPTASIFCICRTCASARLAGIALRRAAADWRLPIRPCAPRLALRAGRSAGGAARRRSRIRQSLDASLRSAAGSRSTARRRNPCRSSSTRREDRRATSPAAAGNSRRGRLRARAHSVPGAPTENKSGEDDGDEERDERKAFQHAAQQHANVHGAGAGQNGKCVAEPRMLAQHVRGLVHLADASYQHGLACWFRRWQSAQTSKRRAALPTAPRPSRNSPPRFDDCMSSPSNLRTPRPSWTCCRCCNGPPWWSP